MIEENKIISAMRIEKDVSVYQRLLAVKMHKIDRRPIRDVARILEKAPSWVSDCAARYEEAGISGLQTKSKSGRTPKVPRKTLESILEKFKTDKTTPLDVTEIIQNITGIKYCVGHVRKLMRRFGLTPKKPQKIHPSHSSTHVIKKWQQNTRRSISRLESVGFEVFVMDEAMFSGHIDSNKKGWTYRGNPWYTTYNQLRKPCVVSGFLSLKDNKQMFRMSDVFNSETFLECIKELATKHQKVAIILDNARPHKSKRIQQYLIENKNVRLLYLPVGSPEHNAVEECWHQSKYDLSDLYFETIEEKIACIMEYFRLRRFNLPVRDYLFRKVSENI